MRFKNNGSDVQVRIKEKSLFGGDGFKWTIVRTNQETELPEEIGKAYGFEIVNDSAQEIPKVTESKIGKVKVETKQFESSFFNELKAINGIGNKTAKDISSYLTKEKLIMIIKSGERLPFRDDVEKLLKEKYGK